MSWESNASIRFRLGTVALWNFLTNRPSVDLTSPTLQVLTTSRFKPETTGDKVRPITFMADEFADMTRAPLTERELDVAAKRIVDADVERARKQQRNPMTFAEIRQNLFLGGGQPTTMREANRRREQW